MCATLVLRLLFSYHPSQEGQVFSRCKPEEQVVSAGVWELDPPPAAVKRAHYYIHGSVQLHGISLLVCNSLIFSMMLLHKLTTTWNSSGLYSPRLLGKGEKQQMRKVKRGSRSRQDTCISPQQLLAENLTKAVQAHQLLFSRFNLLTITTKSMTCDCCRERKKRRNAGSLLCTHSDLG